MGLLFSKRLRRRCDGASQKSICQRTELKQVLQRANETVTLRLRWRCWGELCPIGRDQRLTSVRQNENELQAATQSRMTEDLQRLSLDRMMRQGGRHSLRAARR